MTNYACLALVFAVPGSLDSSCGDNCEKTVPKTALWPTKGVRTDIPRQWRDH